MRVQRGNRELVVQDLLRLTAMAGPVGEQDDDPDALFFRFEQFSFTRSEVLEIVQLVARMKPDECEMSGDDLRLWWD